MNQVGLGLIGLGTVGTGVVKIIKGNSSNVAKRVGAPLKFVMACDKKAKARPDIGLAAKDVVSDYHELINNPEIDVIIELIGGYEPARTIILEALRAGKHVVTANKAVLAKYWDEIVTTAQEHKRLIYFEAAVGGGIPVVQGLNEGLAANRIQKIIGILNGTTNFILTRMANQGLTFADALKQAQEAGFAEADPTFDIEGIDAAHKIAILASIAFGGWVKISDVYCEGISKINLMDLEIARDQFGYGLKLLGIAKEKDGKVEARVHPTFLPKDHPFLPVKDEYNAISIVGDAVDDVMFYGKGAGQLAAASAVVSDVIFLSRHVAEGTAGKLPYVTYDKNHKTHILPESDFCSKYYLRFTTADEPGVLAKISGILGKNRVSIAAVHQPQEHAKSRVGIVIVTHEAQEGKVRKAVAQIDRLSAVKAKTVLIRIEE